MKITKTKVVLLAASATTAWVAAVACRYCRRRLEAMWQENEAAEEIQAGVDIAQEIIIEDADIEEQEQQPEPVEALAIPAAVANLVAEQQAEEIRALDEEAQPDDEQAEQSEVAEVDTPAAAVPEIDQQEDQISTEIQEQEEQQQSDSVGTPAMPVALSSAVMSPAEEVEVAPEDLPLINEQLAQSEDAELDRPVTSAGGVQEESVSDAPAPELAIPPAEETVEQSDAGEPNCEDPELQEEVKDSDDSQQNEEVEAEADTAEEAEAVKVEAQDQPTTEPNAQADQGADFTNAAAAAAASVNAEAAPLPQSKEEDEEEVIKPHLETPIFGFPQAQAQTPAEAPVFRRRIRAVKAAKAIPQQSASEKPADVDVPPRAVSCAEAAHKQYEAELRAAKQAEFIKARQQALFEQEAIKQQALLKEEAAKKGLTGRPKVRVMRCRGKPEGAAAMPPAKTEACAKAEEPAMTQGTQPDTFIVSQQQADPAKAGKAEGVPATAEAVAMPACSIQIARRQRKIVRRGNRQAQSLNRTAVAQ